MVINSDKDVVSTRVIAFTGGGSAGHITPNLALIDVWSKRGGSAIYFGRRDSLEEQLLNDLPHIPFYRIPSERLRRYFHWANFIMPLIVLLGIIRSSWLLWRTRPLALFSKGGFVSLPVVIGAWINRIPVYVHESDGTLGLANRLSLPFTTTVCLGQSRALTRVKHRDVRVTGSPLRADFLNADPTRAIDRFNLSCDRPLLLIFGGSLGAQKINETVWESLPWLLERYEVFHVVGQGHLSTDHQERFNTLGYLQYEYVKEGFAELLAQAHLVVCRAGANAIAELIALQKPALLVPLSTHSSRGDQALNAEGFVDQGGGQTVINELFTKETLINLIENLEEHYSEHQQSLAALPYADSSNMILDLFDQ